MIRSIFHLFLLEVGFLLGPVVILILILHLLERWTILRLARQFGWKSILWTGWLGTPIHELSHAAACFLFGHRIDSIALFQPDLDAGRLGYVKHSYNRKNLYQEAGNFFIGIAPVIGGTGVLVLLLVLFYPEAARATLAIEPIVESLQELKASETMSRLVDCCLNVVWMIEPVKSVATLKFWFFLYLVLSVALHMAPSPSDYRGTTKGGLFLILIWLTATTLQVVFDLETGWMIRHLAPVSVMSVVLLSIAVVLCFVSTVVVWIMTELIDLIPLLSTRR